MSKGAPCQGHDCGGCEGGEDCGGYGVHQVAPRPKEQVRGQPKPLGATSTLDLEFVCGRRFGPRNRPPSEAAALSHSAAP